jgi:hypothetical protein
LSKEKPRIAPRFFFLWERKHLCLRFTGILAGRIKKSGARDARGPPTGMPALQGSYFNLPSRL